MKRKIADVYIDPGNDGHEWPTPIPWHRPYTVTFVRAYAAACRAIGQGVRIVWYG